MAIERSLTARGILQGMVGHTGPEERPIQPLVVVEDLVGGIPADHLQKGAVLRRMYRRAGGDEQRELAPAARDGKAKGPPKVSVSGVQAMWPPSATRKTNWSGSASGVPARASIASNTCRRVSGKGFPERSRRPNGSARPASLRGHRPRLRIQSEHSAIQRIVVRRPGGIASAGAAVADGTVR